MRAEAVRDQRAAAGEATRDGPGAVLALAHISAGYGPDLVLTDVSLSVGRGEFVAVVGPNGSGKSTLLKVALGLLKPRGGEVRLFGVSLRRFRGWKRVGYVPQQVAALGGSFPASVGEVVALGRNPHVGLLRPFSGRDRAAVADAMERCGVAQLRERPLNELSGGQRQRVFLARALAGEPDLLLLDEPAASIDPEGRSQFAQVIGALNRDRRTAVVYVSHDLPSLRDYLTRVVLIDRAIVFDGSPEELERRAEFGVFLEEAHHFEHVVRSGS